MDTITSIRLAVNEYIAEDPESRRKMLIRGPAPERILKRADEIYAQRWMLIAERSNLLSQKARVDQSELILSDR